MQQFMNRHLLIAFLFLTATSAAASAQWTQDYTRQLEIPDIINLQSSDTHLYALSESEGLVVFRAHTDSLQWLYSSTGMQQRGHIMDTDIRFAYLYGNNRRLTVIEPTSVLGVYSSTVLPHTPLSARRAGNILYLALGTGGLGKLSLESPETVDSDVQYIDANRFDGESVNQLALDRGQALYVLAGDNTIEIYDIGNEENPVHNRTVGINRSVQKLFLTGNDLTGTDEDGNIFLIHSNGNTSTVSSVSGPVRNLELWQDQLVVLTEDGELWIGPREGGPERWKAGRRGGNFFTVTENSLWVADAGRVTPVMPSPGSGTPGSTAQNGDSLELEAIQNITLPFPRALILPLEVVQKPAGSRVNFSYEAPFDNAVIRGNTFYWQPAASQSGSHRVQITAAAPGGHTDQTEFTINLTPFNSPPRFSPSRPVTIPAGEVFELEIRAVDPDGLDANLIRYLGADMPDGARLNEKTGLFTWSPSRQQVGNHTFQVIATDQFGAAASQDVEIRVIEIREETSDENNL